PPQTLCNPSARPIIMKGPSLDELLPQFAPGHLSSGGDCLMVAKIEFKQQCPSCEAMVPVRDRKLIGRKIDCPKCKYRFVVEDPEAEAEEAEEAPDKKKGKNGVAAKSKKGKPGKGKGDEGKPKKKAAPGSKRTLYLGLGLGVVALIVLGLVGFLMFGGSRDSGKKGPSKGAGPAAVQDKDKDRGGEKDKPGPAAPSGVTVDVTN